MMKKFFACIAVLALLSGCGQVDVDTEKTPGWKSPRGGIYNSSGTMIAPQQPLRVVWDTRLENPTKTSPVVGGDRVVMSDEKGVLYCFDASDGKIAWRRQLFAGSAIQPVIANGMVIVGDGGGVLFSINLGTGNNVWTYDIKNPALGWPIIDTGRIWVVTKSELFCVEETKGSLLFSKEYGKEMTQGISLQRYLYLTSKNELVAVVPENGNQVWTAKTKSDIIAPPTCQGKRVVAVDGDIYFFEDVDGRTDFVQMRESFDVNGKKIVFPFTGPVSTYINVMVAANSRGQINAFQTEPVKQVWSFIARQNITAPVIIGKQSVYLGSADGRVSICETSSGKWQWHNDFGSPIVGLAATDVSLFAASADGQLKRMDAGGKALTIEDLRNK